MTRNCVPTHFYHICISCADVSQLIYIVTEIINYQKNPADTENTNAIDLPCTSQHANLHTSNLLQSPLNSDSKFLAKSFIQFKLKFKKKIYSSSVDFEIPAS